MQEPNAKDGITYYIRMWDICEEYLEKKEV